MKLPPGCLAMVVWIRVNRLADCRRLHINPPLGEVSDFVARGSIIEMAELNR